MFLKKSGYLRQNIDETEPGQLEWVTGLFFLLFLGILLCATLQLDIFRASAGYLEDALAASNLASAVIDVEEYGISHDILIGDPYAAYDAYLLALKGNLNLNEGWECVGQGLISGRVRVLNYTIYNVNGDGITVYSFDEDGLLSRWEGIHGGVWAPNGNLIEHTGIYSRVAYPVKGLFGVQAEACKGKLVDIVTEE